MVVEKPPRIVLNDDFVDLRDHSGPYDGCGEKATGNTNRDHPNNQSPTLKNKLRYEKELINCGLKKLANKYNDMKIKYRRSSSIEQRRKRHRKESPTVDPRPQSYDRKQTTSHQVDPRLCEKYSVLNLAWKRSWTLPIFSPKSTTVVRNRFDTFDRQTYLYDDGTEVDSTYANTKQKKLFSKDSQSHWIPLALITGGAFCALVLVSIIIWIIFGRNLLELIFHPRVTEDGAIKRYTKYIGGSIIHLIASFFRTIGRVLVTPAQNVYQPQPDYYRWPVNPM